MVASRGGGSKDGCKKAASALERPGEKDEKGKGTLLQFRGYGDVTATYIRRSEIPSHIYTKY